jgi:hypothetical protein
MSDGSAVTRGGTMPEEYQEQMDKLLSEFVEAVASISDQRHLQRGIARSLLPSNLIIILDKKNIFVVGQFNPKNRTAMYIYTPDSEWTAMKVASSAEWEFGLRNIYLVEIPRHLLEEIPEQRKGAIKEIAEIHIDSEFKRFMEHLSLLRTRPIFGPPPIAADDRLACLLLPQSGSASREISEAVDESGMTSKGAGNITDKVTIREMWMLINESRVVIADLTSADPGVMYGLGIAHTLGKDTILVSPEGSVYLPDLTRTTRIEYIQCDEGKLKEDLTKILLSMIQLITAA